MGVHGVSGIGDIWRGVQGGWGGGGATGGYMRVYGDTRGVCAYSMSWIPSHYWDDVVVTWHACDDVDACVDEA
jgi:hypothetical protein